MLSPCSTLELSDTTHFPKISNISALKFQSWRKMWGPLMDRTDLLSSSFGDTLVGRICAPKSSRMSKGASVVYYPLGRRSRDSSKGLWPSPWRQRPSGWSAWEMAKAIHCTGLSQPGIPGSKTGTALENLAYDEPKEPQERDRGKRDHPDECEENLDAWAHGRVTSPTTSSHYIQWWLLRV